MPFRFYRCDTSKHRFLACFVCCLAIAFSSNHLHAQMGGGGMGGGQAQAPAAATKPKFSDHIHNRDGMALRREAGDAVVAEVRLVGNQVIRTTDILAEIQTRKGRFYSEDTVLSDVGRLNDMGSFDHVTFEAEERLTATPGSNGSAPQKSVLVTFYVRERAMVSQVIYHGDYGMNDRELSGRSGITAGDPLSEFAIETGKRRLIDYYHEEGFNQAAIIASIGLPGDPNAVVFRINEGPKERIRDIRIEGASIVSESRLKKIIQSRGPMMGIMSYIGNVADMKKIDADVDVLASYYHNLGFLTATVGRRIEYDRTGKWMTIVFVVNEGPRFSIGDIQIVGNEFITEESLRRRLELKANDVFSGTKMRKDIGEIVYGYGELGFIYAEVNPKTIMRDENGIVDLVFEITEGDRWKVNSIRVEIDGEPHLMRETTMLNLIEMREGDYIDRRDLETGRNRIERSQLLETNPTIAAPPDIIVKPLEESLR
ncbi:outer membrane protein assembly complex, YaeT protein [Rhodopirellula islandica]|uniref:Outer membrane protein assembly complex, YaeT protein n=1 Tax=Rhodopirellula islandica TaxID=595434 RepID=A0A0J1EPD1_RHOIS|nr:POTRA domain-containing protein [Rhodopirellula islandica]KLU07339.1 outer membrane protein assembly complex, YaeT protein [Rhodopirellula islandica]